MPRYQLDMGVRVTPVKAFAYGPEGIGKSTLAAQMPGVVFIDVEGGTNQLPVARMPRPTSWQMLLDEVRAVRDGDVAGCSTLVIDTADAAERLCVAHVCAKEGKESIEAFGYGRGFTFLVEEYGRLVDLLSEVAEHGRNVMVLGHSRLTKTERPDESGAYDRFEPKLTDTKKASVSALLKEWCDMLLFLDYKVYVVQDSSGKAKASGGQRVIRTTHSVTWDAKNRFGLPEEMPLDEASAAAIAALMVGGEALSAQGAPAEAEVAQAPTTGAEAPQTAPDAPVEAPTGKVAYPPRMSALSDLMLRDDVRDSELRAAVASRGYFPEECKATDYPQEFVEWLVSVWPSFMKQIELLRTDVPFDAQGE